MTSRDFLFVDIEPGRLRCCVPFCRKSRRNDVGFDEWICGDHWRMVDKSRRQVWGRINKRFRRFGPKKSTPAYCRVWSALKRQAIERATGIGA